MRRRTERSNERGVEDYRHDDATRTNNPPAGIASHGQVHEKPRQEYAYNPHLPPCLQFDENGGADQLPELLAKAQRERLSADEVQILAAALKNHSPWLEWAGKQEAESFSVDPVALHIHERVSAKAIVKVAERENVQRELFADPQLEYLEAVQFYQHDVDWTNRLILGDSLTVMNSLAQREDLAGKVQMIYIDPPYGIKFASNFQSTVFQRDVKEKEEDLTREREQIKAYRDTWTLGVHSYLAYLRDRLIVAKELLTDSGSIFVQISDENLHRIRCLLDEVFGNENFVRLIHFRKTGALMSQGLDEVGDYIVWYAKDNEKLKYYQLYEPKIISKSGLSNYPNVLLSDGTTRNLKNTERQNPEQIPKGAKLFGLHALNSQSGGPNSRFPINFKGKTFTLSAGGWKTNEDGIQRLIKANRIDATDKRIGFVRYMNDFPAIPITNLWDDTRGEMDLRYIVQTSTNVIERCLLMTTDPGDLVLDPTCGSGTTAYVAESRGRRWITIDTSRVAVAVARQRLLTGTYDYYKLNDESKGVGGGFVNKTVPHITLRSIAQNTALDPIFAKHEPILKEKLENLNRALEEVTPEIRTKLLSKLAAKERSDGVEKIHHGGRPAALATSHEGVAGVGSAV